MNKYEVIDKTKDYIKDKLQGEGSGHDWWHIYRVWNNAKFICSREKGDSFIVELAALLHDIADWKFNNGDEEAGPRAAGEWLDGLGVESGVIDQVKDIIRGLSFKGANVKDDMKTIEGMIVQDADRLDAIGAVGIGRAFAYGGFKGREMYNPDIKVEMHNSFEEYKKNSGPTINHFYEKLLLLKDRMNTETAKELALERHKFMESFLENFYREWDCNY